MAYTEWDSRESFPEAESLATLIEEAKSIPLDEETFRLLDQYFTAMANLYGVIPLRDAYTIIHDLNGEIIDRERFLAAAEIMRRRREAYEIIGEGGPEEAKDKGATMDWEIINQHVVERGPEEYYFLVESQVNKPFRKFSKEDLLSYGEPDAMKKAPEYVRLAELMQKAEGSEENKGTALDELLFSARTTGLSLNDVPQMLAAFDAGFRLVGDFEDFRKALVEYFNATPLLVNRGMTPTEFSADTPPAGYEPTAEQNNRAVWVAIQEPEYGRHEAELSLLL